MSTPRKPRTPETEAAYERAAERVRRLKLRAQAVVEQETCNCEATDTWCTHGYYTDDGDYMPPAEQNPGYDMGEL